MKRPECALTFTRGRASASWGLRPSGVLHWRASRQWHITCPDTSRMNRLVRRARGRLAESPLRGGLRDGPRNDQHARLQLLYIREVRLELGHLGGELVAAGAFAGYDVGGGAVDEVGV